MAYSDKVQAAVNAAHETAIANKILDMMQDLKLKNDEKTACRWIWELIQNAKDVAGDTGSVNIEIEFNEKDHYLSFKHDGKSFTTDNIVFLISQVSSKERNQTSESTVTGKFGTGFLTTHLLSEKVKIEAYLQDEAESLKKINILLDRSGETKEEVIASVNESFRQLKTSTEIDASSVEDNNGFNTSFLYELDNHGIEIAKKGLENFSVSIPYVFAFVEQIHSVRINNSYYVERGKKFVNGNMEAHAIKITENGNLQKNYVVVYHEENVDIAIPVIVQGEEVLIDEYSKQTPKLFCTFPLVGTEDFSFPVIVNSSCFNPNEPRSGIYLTDKENKIIEENKGLMLQALNAYKQLLNYVAKYKWKQVYNIVYIPKQTSKDWLSNAWFDSVIDECKEHIKQVEIIDTIGGERKSLFDFLDDQDIFIIGDSNKTTRELVWEMSQFIYPEQMVLFAEIHKWYNSLWSECRNFNIRKLIEQVEKFGNLNKLKTELNGKIKAADWLNRFYEVLDSIQEKTAFENAKIFPNQLGVFCALDELQVDDDIEEIYKQILCLLGNECKEYLLDKEIKLPEAVSCEIYDYNKFFKELLVGMNDDSLDKPEAMASLVVLYDKQNEDNDEQNELLTLLDGVFPGMIPDDCEVKKVDDEVMEKARKYWCSEIADTVSEHKNVEVLVNHLELDDEETVWSWMSKFIEYIDKYKHKNLFERKTKPIIPNQNGDFITLEEVFLDSGEIDDVFKDIVSEMGDDIRGILLPIDIYLELPASREKGLKDVAYRVTEYVKERQGLSKNQDEGVRRNFNRLFCWMNDNPEKASIHFKEIVDNKHWLYNDEEIALNMKKAEKYDDLLKRYNIQDTNDLEKVLKEYSQNNEIVSVDEVEISEELMIQYGISSVEEFEKAREFNVFKENFVHASESDQKKFEYVKEILERSKVAIFKYLEALPEYDVSSPISVTNTIFIVKKYNKEIAIITRPSDYGQVILYYDTEKDILDYEKEYELWVEDGKTAPQQITFGKMLKLTGINRIPLRKVI